MERVSEWGGSTGDRRTVVIPYGYTSGYQCLRSFHRRGFRTVLGVSEEPAPERASRYCDETILLPSPDRDLLAYRDALLQMAARRDVATVVPLREAEVYLLSRYRAAFEDHIDFAVPPFETLKRVQDRLRLTAAAEAAGVPVPETARLDDVRTADRELLVKSRFNILTREYVDAFGPGDAAEVNQIEYIEPGDDVDVDAICDEMGHVPIAQEYVRTSEEYMVGAIADAGEPLVTAQLRQIRETPYFGGGGVYRESVRVEELTEITERLLRHLDWHGLACLEFMEDAETGEYKLAEINPRLWQSLPPIVRAGADFPHYYWLLSAGSPDRIHAEYEEGVTTHYLIGELNHVMSLRREDCPFVDRPMVLGTLLGVLASCITQPQFDYLRLDDPGPFLSDFSTLVKLAGSKVLG